VVLAACTSPVESAEPKPTATTQTEIAPATTGAPLAKAAPPTITLAFAGDVHFEGALGGRLAADPHTALAAIRPVLAAADFSMVNLETAVTSRGTPAPKDFVFRAPPSAFSALAAAGVDAASMANNHGMDFGRVGLEDSLAAAEKAGFPVLGIGRDEDAAYAPRVFEVAGASVAVVAATQVLDSSLATAWTAGPGKPGLASAKRVDRLVGSVREAARRAGTVVVFLHWGQERNTCPIGVQTGLARRLAEAGADVVVGSHAHVLLGGGMLGPAYVHYGLGNFAFYARGGAGAQTGVLQLKVKAGRVVGSRWRPAVIEGGAPQPLQGDAAALALLNAERRRGCTGLEPGPGW
jgi:poly-gamma-glutamate synthesis protein (capsule biosynthesis protein)